MSAADSIVDHERVSTREQGPEVHKAERQAARTAMTNVYRLDWWDRAAPEQVGHTYQVVRGWSQEDPEAARAEQRVRDEVRVRYGIDISDVGPDPEAVRQYVRGELERAARDRAGGDAERERSADEQAEAQRILTQASQENQQAEEARAAAAYEPDPEERAHAADRSEQHEAAAERAHQDGSALYDSAERRADTAQGLAAKGIGWEAVDTRMRADVSQAKPATETVKADAVVRTPKVRRSRVRAARVRRTGLGR